MSPLECHSCVSRELTSVLRPWHFGPESLDCNVEDTVLDTAIDSVFSTRLLVRTVDAVILKCLGMLPGVPPWPLRRVPTLSSRRRRLGVSDDSHRSRRGIEKTKVCSRYCAMVLVFVSIHLFARTEQLPFVVVRPVPGPCSPEQSSRSPLLLLTTVSSQASKQAAWVIGIARGRTDGGARTGRPLKMRSPSSGIEWKD